MTRKQKSSSWRDWMTFPENFSYDVNAPIEDVVQTLVDLEKERGFFTSSSQEISVIPSGEEYQFRFRIRRRSSVTASAEGVIWEDDTGVHIEGQARLTQNVLFLSAFSFVFLFVWAMMFISMARFAFGILPLIFVLIGLASNVYAYWRDRQRVIEEIEKGIGQAALNTHLQKQRRTSTTQRLAVSERSVWDEALSEEDDQRGRSRR